MVDSVLFYISAASDLRNERDLISQVITEIPVTLGWNIHLSPLRDKPIENKSIEEADIHLLVLGEDIRAPIGLEWFIAKQSGRAPTLIYKDGISRTPAAIDFYRTLSRSHTFQPYNNLDYLRHISLKSICRFLLSHSGYFALDKSEVEELSSYTNDLVDSAPKQIEDIHGGTGENSVILSPERFVPSTGVLIEQPDPSDDEGK